MAAAGMDTLQVLSVKYSDQVYTLPCLYMLLLSYFDIFFYLQTSKGSVLQKVWQGIVKMNETDPDVLSTPIEVHLDKLRRGWYVYLIDQVIIDNNMKCDISLGKELFLPLNVAVGIQKRSPLQKIISDQ